MDLKDLNNYQLILLTLLVSFVTSIATGITTVYLLEQAPPQVTGVINRVVEKTIQEVTPSTDTKPQTIIISEDNLVAQALVQGFQEVGALYTPAQNSGGSAASAEPVSSALPVETSSLAANASGALADDSGSSDLSSAASATTTSPNPPAASQTPPASPAPNAADSLVSLGVLVDTSGTFIVPDSYVFTKGDYVMMSGDKYDVTGSSYDKADNISVVTLSPESGAKSFADLSPNGVGDLPQAGQTALVIGTNDAFVKTIISRVTPPAGDQTDSTMEVQDSIDAKFFGAPILSSDGKIIGLVSFDASGNLDILGSDAIKNALNIATSQTAQSPADGSQS